MEKKKLIIMCCTIGVLVLGGSVYAVNETNYKKVVQTVANKQSVQNKTLDQLIADAESMFTDNEQYFLKSEVSTEHITDLTDMTNTYFSNYKTFEESVNALREKDKHSYSDTKLSNKQEKLRNLVGTVLTKTATSQSVNQLFQKEYMSGDKQNADSIIKDDLKQEELAQVKKEYFTEKLDEKDTTKAFELAVNKGISLAEAQVKQIEKADKAISELYKDKKATDKVSRATFEAVKKEVNTIKNDKAKKSFDEALKAIEAKVKDIEKKADEEKAKAEAEKVAQEIGGNVEKAEDGTYNVTAQDGSQYQNESASGWTDGNTSGNGGSTGGNGGSTGGSGGSTGGNGGSTGGSGGSTGGSGGSTGGNGGSTGGNGGSTGGNGGSGGGTQIPDGWIVPPYPIGSGELMDWIANNGYSGYDSSGGYIRPY